MSEAMTQQLIRAAMEGNLEKLQAALDAGVSANIAADKEYGTKPLHWAADNGRPGAIEVLLAKRADVCAVDKQNATPLHAAAANGSIQSISLLLEAKANVTAQDINQWTPLHLAAVQGQAGAIFRLVEGKANVMSEDSKGETPLHVAASCCESEAVKALLEAKADVLKTADEKVPLFLARVANGPPPEKIDATVAILEEATKVERQKRRELEAQSAPTKFLGKLASCVCCKS
eukprot:TRINITY_DN38560_c0_g1_i2.p1 TRINITY_DN38560_c0_g1~~TRINITY_DN38560_c0_g1_i2.p1  ORF type:complete len:232 (+),score=65.82 TRINITY_DN38560_c0_g1_i2:71-766(+)